MAARNRVGNIDSATNSSEGGGGSVRNPPRREFSARTKRQAWERANGYCEGWIADIGRCNAPLENKPHYYDHIDPDWYSKDNELDNCQVICVTCERSKTRNDIKNISKSKRIIDKQAKVRKKKGKFRGWRKFDGTVVLK